MGTLANFKVCTVRLFFVLHEVLGFRVWDIDVPPTESLLSQRLDLSGSADRWYLASRR